MAPRILILAPLLLHGAETPRGIRSRRLAEGLAGRGFEVDLATFGERREEAGEAGRGLRLLTARGSDPLAYLRARSAGRALRRLDGLVRGDPDGLGPWRRALGERLEREARSPDLVYAIGLPVGAIAAGRVLAERHDVPLVADLGDPWPLGSLASRRERRRSLAGADALVTTTTGLAEELGGFLRPGAEVAIIPNGGETRRRLGAHRPPLFVHLGAITSTRVAPEPAFEALAALHREGRIELRSHSSGWRAGFEALPHPHLPMLPHGRALELLASASAALVLGNNGVRQLPSKAFEIACTETWALCVSELRDDPAAAVLELSGHAVRAANDPSSVAAAVEEILAREARGERPSPDPAHAWERRIDSVAELTGRLAGR